MKKNQEKLDKTMEKTHMFLGWSRKGGEGGRGEQNGGQGGAKQGGRGSKPVSFPFFPNDTGGLGQKTSGSDGGSAPKDGGSSSGQFTESQSECPRVVGHGSEMVAGCWSMLCRNCGSRFFPGART